MIIWKSLRAIARRCQRESSSSTASAKLLPMHKSTPLSNVINLSRGRRQLMSPRKSETRWLPGGRFEVVRFIFVILSLASYLSTSTGSAAILSATEESSAEARLIRIDQKTGQDDPMSIAETQVGQTNIELGCLLAWHASAISIYDHKLEDSACTSFAPPRPFPN